jgi:hypothetical protein
MPGIEGIGVDLWCYEDSFRKAKRSKREGRTLVLFHEHEGNRLESRFEPVPGGVEITVTLSGSDEEAIKNVEFLNMCVTYQRSQAFSNEKDKFDESYLSDFVGRSFVFLEQGLTRLVDTERIPSIDERDNPFSARGRAPKPWVQEYIPTWIRRSDFVRTFYGRRPLSSDRPVYPIIGVISRDERFLSAIAWPDCSRLGQLFISCVHANPKLAENYDPATNRCATRGKVYFMENDAAKLLDRFAHDFPDWTRPPDAD